MSHVDAAGWEALQHLLSVLLELMGEPVEQEHCRLPGSPFFLAKIPFHNGVFVGMEGTTSACCSPMHTLHFLARV